MERTEIGAKNLGAIQHRVEVLADNLLAPRPFPQSAVAPDDRVVGVQQHDSVGHAFQNAFVLQELAHAERFADLPGGHEHAGIVLAAPSARAREWGCAPLRLRIRPVRWETGQLRPPGRGRPDIFGLAVKLQTP